MTKRSSLFDKPDSFGWISIALHWSTALAIVALWFVGKSIAFQAEEALDARRSLHITLGLIFWLPLAARIAWRILVAHPHASGQSRLTHNLARTAHYLLLALLLLMLVSGPLLAWLAPGKAGITEVLLFVHANTALVLAMLVGLHVLAALKHLMFHEDETIARIFLPRKDN
ncbi:MAG: hypothetical protein EXR84_00545 [Gammaproteobacteria bacterium]|nr:hypothetical protein [Gammaproteobacteria bacterium]